MAEGRKRKAADRDSFERQRDALVGRRPLNEASLRIAVGRASLESHVAISTAGLAAVGGMVSGILLSAAAIVWVSTRKLPKGAMPKGMHRPWTSPGRT
jgi:hypothetical protein